MKFTASVFAALTGAAFAASAPYTAHTAPTGTPCPSESATSPGVGGTAPYPPTAPITDPAPGYVATTPTTPTKTPCPSSMPGYTSGPTGTGPSTPGYASNPTGYAPGAPSAPGAPGFDSSPESDDPEPSPPVLDDEDPNGTHISTKDGVNSTAVGNTTVSVGADPDSGAAAANAEEGGATLAGASVGSGLGLAVSGRTFEEDPAPSPEAIEEVETIEGSSEIAIGNLTATASGQNSAVAGATTESAAAAGSGTEGVLAAAMASPGAPGALGLAF